MHNLYKIFRQHPHITTDSRNVAVDSLFFALSGERFNGNAFAKDALEKGAAYAIMDDTEYYFESDKTILVEDSLTTLQELARCHRQQFEIPVFAITGSNGKTTTKELLATVLSCHYNVHYTQGNLNNHIGVPLTLLSMPEDTEIAIIEMGANHIGEIATLCSIALPTHGLITNIGKAHLEGFGSLEGVKKAKAELYDFLATHNGLAFVNIDEDFLEALAEPVQYIARYGNGFGSLRARFRAMLLDEFPHLKVYFISEEMEDFIVQTQIYGRYNYANILSAIAAGMYFRVPAHKIKTAIEAYVPASNRSQIMERGTNTIILDAYNANPVSMHKALESFTDVDAKYKVAILGDMLELGETSITEHQHMIEYALTLNLNSLVLVGKQFKIALANVTTQKEVLHSIL